MENTKFSSLYTILSPMINICHGIIVINNIIFENKTYTSINRFYAFKESQRDFDFHTKQAPLHFYYRYPITLTESQT